MCDNCEQEQPFNNCPQCHENLCEECSEIHKKVRKTKDHTLLPLQALSQESCDEVKNVEKLQKIKKIADEHEQELLKRKETLDTNQDRIIRVIQEHFDKVVQKVIKRKDKLIAEVRDITSKRENTIQEAIKDLRGCQTRAKQLIEGGDHRTSMREIDTLMKKASIDIDDMVPQSDNIVLWGSSPEDDLDKMVDAIGHIQHGFPDPRTPVRSLSADGKTQPAHVMTVFKDPSFDDESAPENHCRPELASVSQNTQAMSFNHSIIPETFVINDVHPHASGHGLVPTTTEHSQTRTKLYASFQVLAVLDKRLSTNNLGHCKVEIHTSPSGDASTGGCVKGRTVVYAHTPEEATLCLRLLQELIFEENIKIPDASLFLFESDKWQVLSRTLEQEYPSQVAFEIDHAMKAVVCLSINKAYLLHTVEAVRKFISDNRTNTIKMFYDERLVRRLENKSNEIKGLLKSYSQYLVSVTFSTSASSSTESSTDKSESYVSVTGIGSGLAEVIRSINKMAQKCGESSCEDEDRFDDTADADRDELTRHQEPLPVNLQMTMAETATKVQCMCTPAVPHVLYIMQGDILTIPAEGLVNPADPRLKHDGGLAKTILAKGGRSIQEECTDHVTRQGEVQPGHVFVSKAGNLIYKNIFHASGRKWNGGNQNEAAVLGDTIRNLFAAAAKNGVTSLAMPAIGTGSFKYPVKVTAETILDTIKTLWAETPTCCVREVYLCDFSEDAVRAFVDTLTGVFKDCDIVTSAQNRQVMLLF